MGTLIGIKGELNIITLLISLITGLGGFGTWTLYEGYNTAKAEIIAMREYRQNMSIRLEKLEVTNEDRWRGVELAIGQLNSKFDLITEVKVRK